MKVPRATLIAGALGFLLVVGFGWYKIRIQAQADAEVRLRHLAQMNGFPERDYIDLDHIVERWEKKRYERADFDQFLTMLRNNADGVPKRVFRFKCISLASALKGSPFQSEAVSAIENVMKFERDHYNPDLESWRYFGYVTLKRLGSQGWAEEARADLATTKTSDAKSGLLDLLAQAKG